MKTKKTYIIEVLWALSGMFSLGCLGLSIATQSWPAFGFSVGLAGLFWVLSRAVSNNIQNALDEWEDRHRL